MNAKHRSSRTGRFDHARLAPVHLVLPSGRVHAVRHGRADAPLVLGLPGLTSGTDQLGGIGAAIAAAGGQLVALDLRGRGRSDRTGAGTYGWVAHARDVVAVAGALGAERFALVGVSMGASVAMVVAASAGDRVHAVVLVDTAGRVDPGVAPAVAGAVDAASDVDPAALAEDRSSVQLTDPYARWAHLTMPVLLVRAGREVQPGAGHVVPAADRDRFAAEVPRAEVVEVDADHLTVAAHPATAAAIASFLTRERGR
jgi:pimeloyl-ACP methyl ester carboxylesterase